MILSNFNEGRKTNAVPYVLSFQCSVYSLYFEKNSDNFKSAYLFLNVKQIKI